MNRFVNPADNSMLAFLVIENLRPFEIANRIECGLWVAIGLVCSYAAGRMPQHTTKLMFLAVTLFAFGASDLVEAQTGAWWRPWWLLVWKGVCIVVGAALTVAILRARRAQISD